MVPRYRQLIAISYKYTVQKVLSFISTEGAGIIKAGVTYSYTYSDSFYNSDIHPVSCTIDMSKFFGYVNDVEPHKKSR